MVQPKAATSLVWNYFDVPNRDNKRAVCRYCHRYFSFASTITNLKAHLRRRHIYAYREFCQMVSKEISKNSDNENNEISNDDLTIDTEEIDSDDNQILLVERTDNIIHIDNWSIPSTSSSTPKKAEVIPTASCTPRIETQPLIHKRRKLGSGECAVIDKCLLKLITTDLQPISVVENEAFIAYTNALNPNYDIPHRKTISTKLLPEAYKTLLQATKQLINKFCKSICLTVDSWISKNQVEYIAVTGHFIHTETLELISILIQCSALVDPSTPMCIAEEINKIADDWKISEKINFIVTGNSTNMITAAQLLGWDYFSCYIHKLNLIVQEALNLHNIAATVQNVHKTVSYFKSHPHAEEKLLKYQAKEQDIMSGYRKGLRSSMPTRWSSTYLMLQRFWELQEALSATICKLHGDLPIISMDDWKCIEQVVEVLKPLYEVTLIMSDDKYFSASKALIITQGLLAIFKRLIIKDYCSSVREVVKCLTNGITTIFTHLECNVAVGICTYLDPRFKQHGFNNQDTVVALKGVLVDKIATIYSSDANNMTTDSPAEETFSIWENFDRKVMYVKSPKVLRAKAEAEVEMYLKQPVIPRTTCPFQWWREHKTIYPYLFSLFIKNYNIIITSMPCDREFSKAGHIISQRRANLTSSKVMQIMFINANEQIIESML